MLGLLIIAVVWFGLGGLGAWLAYRGSVRHYGKNIYGRWIYPVVVLCGFGGFVGSAVAW